MMQIWKTCVGDRGRLEVEWKAPKSLLKVPNLPTIKNPHRYDRSWPGCADQNGNTLGDDQASFESILLNSAQTACCHRTAIDVVNSCSRKLKKYAPRKNKKEFGV